MSSIDTEGFQYLIIVTVLGIHAFERRIAWLKFIDFNKIRCNLNPRSTYNTYITTIAIDNGLAPMRCQAIT